MSGGLWGSRSRHWKVFWRVIVLESRSYLEGLPNDWGNLCQSSNLTFWADTETLLS